MRRYKNLRFLASAALELVPVIIPSSVAVFGIVAVLLLVTGFYSTWSLLLFGVGLALIAATLIAKYYPYKDAFDNGVRARTFCNGLLLAGVIIWVGFNALYTSQHLLINRDPGIYANAGVWLTKHDNLKIKTVKTYQTIPNTVNSGGAGFGMNKDRKSIYAQGTHVIPAILGFFGRLFGTSIMFHAPILLGGTALLAVYALGRQFMKGWWAVATTTALAFSLPMIYFSRDSYTEPFAMLAVFGGLSVLGIALKVNKSVALWILSGLLLGTSVVARIDGFLVVAAVLAFLVAYLALQAKKEREQKQALKNVAWMTVGLVPPMLVGWFDLRLLSRPYLGNQLFLIKKELLLCFVIVVLGAIVVRLAWNTKFLKQLDGYTRSWRNYLAPALILAGFLILMSRFLWYTGYLFARPGFRGPHEVRSFSEVSTYWVSWYTGPTLMMLGVFGLAYAAGYVLKKRDYLLMAFVAVISATSIVYFIQPSIYPDQIWASRRMLPVIMPGLLIFAFIAVDKLYTILTPKVSVKWSYAFAFLATIYLLAVPLTVSYPLLKVRDTAQLGAVQPACDVLSPGQDSVVWTNSKYPMFIMPTRGLCGVDAIGYKAPISNINSGLLKKIYAQAASEDKRAIIGTDTAGIAAFDGRYQTEDFTLVSVYSYLTLERTRNGPPQKATNNVGDIFLAQVTKDGGLTPLVTKN